MSTVSQGSGSNGHDGKYVVVGEARALVVELANLVGDVPAMIVQQVHYWTRKTNNYRDDRKWVYNTVAQWNKQFPWVGRTSLGSMFRDLRDRGILLAGNYNKTGYDRTLWYAVDYEKLAELGFTLDNTPSKSTKSGSDNWSESDHSGESD